MPLLNLPQLADPRLLEKLRREPVAVRAAVGAVVTLLVQFGVPVSDGQANALTGLAWALVVLSARAKVTPVKPRTTHGNCTTGCDCASRNA